jgi:hypothetical protein
VTTLENEHQTLKQRIKLDKKSKAEKKKAEDKKETTKNMVTSWNDVDQGCSNNRTIFSDSLWMAWWNNLVILL